MALMSFAGLCPRSPGGDDDVRPREVHDPAGVASTANDVGGAEHNIVAVRRGVLGGLPRGREFREAAPGRANPSASLRAGVIVREQGNPAGHGGGGEPLDRSGNFVAPAFRTLNYPKEMLGRDSRAFDHLRDLVRAVRGVHGSRHVVVEGDYVDPALGGPGDDLGLGIAVEGLVPKMIAGVGAKPRSQALDAVKNGARI